MPGELELVAATTEGATVSCPEQPCSHACSPPSYHQLHIATCCFASLRYASQQATVSCDIIDIRCLMVGVSWVKMGLFAC